jgi:YhcH/YjgK/YiaL family protein
MEELEIGRIEIGNGIKVITDEYDTKGSENGFLECHKKYIDIQIVVSGVEEIGYCNRLLCDVREDYNEQTDVEKLSGEMAFFTLRNNGFAVFFPQDAHMPGLKSKGHMNRTKKIVFKVPYSIKT